MKSDAEEAEITFQLDDETYTREYSRTDGGLTSSGRQFTERRELVDLFVRLMQDNEIRRTVVQGDSLRDLLMGPVDTDEIEREIQERKRERKHIEERFREINRKEERLPTLEQQKTDRRSELQEIEEDIQQTRATIDDHELDIEEAEEAERLLEELDERRQELRDTISQIEHQRDRIEELQDTMDEVATELDEIDVPDEELAVVEGQLDELRQQQREIENTIDDLRRSVSFNQEMISDGQVYRSLSDDDVTSQLDPSSQKVQCWTCGSDVTRKAIETQLDELRKLVQQRRSERDTLEEEIQGYEQRAAELERQVGQEEDLTRRLEDLQDEITIREEKQQELETERDELEAEIASIEDKVEQTKERREDDLIDAYKNLSDLEYERGQLEQELTDIEDEIESIEGLANEKEQLIDQKEELQSAITSLRSRIEDLEKDVVDQFNHHIEALIEALQYKNLTRVWIERKTGNETTFDLHIVRESDSNVVYEDTIDTLSESEREVIGLVVALAGYLAHQVYNEVPFMLLDSLEAIDTERIATLIEYFEAHVPFLIIALLPEAANTVPEEYREVSAAELR
jgi:chromosome segregation ATPase